MDSLSNMAGERLPRTFPYVCLTPVDMGTPASSCTYYHMLGTTGPQKLTLCMLLHHFITCISHITLSGVLMARHRRLYAHRMLGPKALWFWLHGFNQLLATACFAAGLAVAGAKFPDVSGCMSVA